MMEPMTIVQFPNKALTVALIAALVNMVATGQLHNIVTAIFYLALIVWAFQEITSGVNWFRRGLGWAVLGYILITQVIRH